MSKLGEDQLGDSQIGEPAKITAIKPEPDFNIEKPRSETSGMHDAISSRIDRIIKRFTESVGIDTGNERTVSLKQVISETIAIADSLDINATLVAKAIKKALAETIGVDESPSRAGDVKRAISIPIGLSESISPTKNRTFFTRKARTVIGISNEPQRYGSVVRENSESIALETEFTPFARKRIKEIISIDKSFNQIANIVQGAIKVPQSAIFAVDDDFSRIATIDRTFSEYFNTFDDVKATRTLALEEVVSVVAEGQPVLDFIRRSKIGKTYANIKDSGLLDS